MNKKEILAEFKEIFYPCNDCDDNCKDIGGCTGIIEYNREHNWLSKKLDMYKPELTKHKRRVMKELNDLKHEELDRELDKPDEEAILCAYDSTVECSKCGKCDEA